MKSSFIVYDIDRANIDNKGSRIVEIKVEEGDVDHIERARGKRPPTDYIDSFNKPSIGTGASILLNN